MVLGYSAKDNHSYQLWDQTDEEAQSMFFENSDTIGTGFSKVC